MSLHIIIKCGSYQQSKSYIIQLSSSVKDQTLHDVNSDLIQTGEFLKDVTANPKRIQCLKRFSKCKDIVEWLREVTKGRLV